jgi:ATP-dependent DNA helicase DinG
MAALCEAFSDFKSKKNLIFWTEQIRLKRGEIFVRYISTPLEISGIMQEAVFKRYRSLVFTSATLTVEGNFEFWKSRVGLSGFTYREVKEYMFPSPYDFENNVLLCIPENVPQPNNEGYEEFLADFISEALRISGGRALVLFTSYRMLRNTLAMVRERFGEKDSGIHILVQGEDDRTRLLDKFKFDLNSVLFATDSFWEGIDAPGKALEMVIICRLPFKVPTEPVILARMEELEVSGSNSFLSLSLPDAIIRLRQGFGRLIRSHSDRGVIVILDSRLVTKNYGRFFLSSLPLTRRIISSPEKILEGILYFFEEIKKGA